MQSKTSSVISNLLWRFLERCGAQGVTFVVSILLARLLDPEVYGTIALVTIFTTIMQVFVDSGLGNALIQKKDADDLDFSSVFYFNIIPSAMIPILTSVVIIPNIHTLTNPTCLPLVICSLLPITG